RAVGRRRHADQGDASAHAAREVRLSGDDRAGVSHSSWFHRHGRTRQMRAVLQGGARVMAGARRWLTLWFVALAAIVRMSGQLVVDATADVLHGLQGGQSDPRQATFERMCSGCHEPERVASIRETAAGWTRIVNDMVTRGADGTPEEVRDVISYL